MRGHINPLQRQKQINSRLKNENTHLREQMSVLEIENARLATLLEKVLLQVEELRTIIFGKKKPKKEPEETTDEKNDSDKTPRGGNRSKDSYTRPTPQETDVTDTEEHPITHCPDCHTELTDKQRIIRYIEDIRFACMDGLEGFKKTKRVTKHIIERGYCPNCKKWHSAIPISSKVTRAGPSVRLFIAHAINILRLSYAQTIECLDTWFGFALSEGELTNILEKASIKLKPEYERIHARILKSKSVHLDETSHQTGFIHNYDWVLTPGDSEEAIFLIGKNRGKGNAKKLLKGYEGVRVTDGYPGYTNLPGTQQRCWAHILRKVRDLTETKLLDEEKHEFVQGIYERLGLYFHKLTMLIETPFDQEERNKQLKKFKKTLRKILNDISTSEIQIAKLTAIKDEIDRAFPQYLTCITHEGVAATNNKAERKLRHLVIKRKTSFGTKTTRGDQILETNLSVMLRLWWTDRASFFPRLWGLLEG